MSDLTYLRIEQAICQFFLFLVPIVVLTLVVYCVNQIRKENHLKKSPDRSPLPAIITIIVITMGTYIMALLQFTLHRSVPYIIEQQQKLGITNLWELQPRATWMNTVTGAMTVLTYLTFLFIAHYYLKQNFWVNQKIRKWVTALSYILYAVGIILNIIVAN